ncbi:MAG: alpha-galactosidase [Leptospirales bacterium]|nr:alpha-galactosidase [Leptospirales bacterium]
MNFPDAAEVRLFYRRKAGQKNRLLVEELKGADVLCSADAAMELHLNRSPGELRPLIRRRQEPIIFLDRVEISLRAGKYASISLHDQIEIDRRFRIYQHGYQSWSASGLKRAGDRDSFVRLPWKHRMDENFETPLQGWLPEWFPLHLLARRGRFHSEWLIGLEELDSDQPARILFTGGAPANHSLRFRLRMDPQSGRLLEFAAIWDFNGRAMGNHARESMTPLLWEFSLPGEPRKVGGFETFLDSAVQRACAQLGRTRAEAPIHGWCSWYYYYNKISESILRQNLAEIRRRQLRLDLFQIDDGWQRALGDWTQPNQQFPAGMAALAAEIKAQSMRAGLWLAPFVAMKNAAIFREFPEAVLRDEDSGKPVRALYNPLWGGWAYALDVSHPHYKAWLANVIDTLVRNWGFDYLKLDFLFAACFRGRRADAQSSGARRLHDVLQLIRRVAGRKTFLLGCGAPLWPAAGLVDGMRISVDVNQVWSGNGLSRLLHDRNYPTAQGALINTLTRSFLHRRTWLNDPDCLMVRGRRSSLSLAQVLMMASVMSVSGGMLLLSDDLSELEEERLAIWEKALLVNRRCAAATPIPLGLLEHPFPRGLYNPAGYLGLWNPGSRPGRITVPAPPGLSDSALRGVRDLWTEQELNWRMEDGRISCALGPFESVVGQVG